MIDLSKVKVGDTVDVRCWVTQVWDKVIYVKMNDALSSDLGGVVGADDIVAHHPKPREFKPGDLVVVRPIVSGPLGRDPGVIIAVHGTRAWVDREGGEPMVWPISHLEHRDG